jgi:GntR family carbon starvation induced transcriptional regulator
MASISENLQSKRAYDNIRKDILISNLKPGYKLKVKNLSEKYGIGVIPIREALSSLESEGLVRHVGQSGFHVSTLSRSEFVGLMKTRTLLENTALKLSIDNYSYDWEERLVIAFHRISRTDRNIIDNGQKFLNPEWLDVHREFHLTLINNSGLEWLTKFCKEMLDHGSKYVAYLHNINPDDKRKTATEHKKIYDAVLSRNVVLAQELLGSHYEFSSASVVEHLS